jgi:drug/metabolite transporter (DMT)-like permease
VASVVAGRLPERRVIIGLAIGLTGAGLITWPTLHQGHSSIACALLIVAAIISYGFALNVARPQQQHGALPVVFRAQGIALILTAPFGVHDVFVAHSTIAPFVSLVLLGSLGDWHRIRIAGCRRPTGWGDACIVHSVPYPAG